MVSGLLTPGFFSVPKFAVKALDSMPTQAGLESEAPGGPSTATCWPHGFVRLLSSGPLSWKSVKETILMVLVITGRGSRAWH